MAQAIKIMTWNIQNLGLTKAGLEKGGNPGGFDIIDAIAKVVVDADVDLLIILEINTTNTDTARKIMSVLGSHMNRYATKSKKMHAGSYSNSMLSHNTGKEYYGFILKNTAIIKPTSVKCSENGMSVDEPEFVVSGDPTNAVDLSKCTFTTITPDTLVNGTNHQVLEHAFPLFKLGLSKKRANLTPLKIDPIEKRYGCLAVFEIANTSLANRFLPIFAFHFNPDHTAAKRQVDKLQYFELFNGLKPGGTAAQTNVIVSGGKAAAPHALNMALITGDFNIDVIHPSPKKGYDTLQSEMNYKALIGANSHLVTIDKYSPRTIKTTERLAVHAYDNFFVDSQSENGVLTSQNGQAINIPELIKTNKIRLNESIDHYAELDQRGFKNTSNNYIEPIKDYKNQLLGSTYQNAKGTLIGARLISDHLPVIIDLSIN
jgi:endonuclease/exonuclease/phosphatase family metal-dependent hydrolase